MALFAIELVKSVETQIAMKAAPISSTWGSAKLIRANASTVDEFEHLGNSMMNLQSGGRSQTRD